MEGSFRWPRGMALSGHKCLPLEKLLGEATPGEGPAQREEGLTTSVDKFDTCQRLCQRATRLADTAWLDCYAHHSVPPIRYFVSVYSH